MLSKLKNKLIVSCQPIIGGPMDKPEIVAAFAQAAIIGGAAALRVEGVENVKAVRAITNFPIIGLVKEELPDSPVKITPFITNIEKLADAGADIIAFDATDRIRPFPVMELINEVKKYNLLTMADCAEYQDGLNALELGVDILATTLSGYTDNTIASDPDFNLVERFSKLDCFVVAEGRYNTPDLAATAIKLGADAVVVGSAITRVENITSWFASAVVNTQKIDPRVLEGIK